MNKNKSYFKVDQKRSKVIADKTSKALEHLKTEKNIQQMKDKYYNELRGQKERSSYNVHEVSDDRYFELLFRAKNPEIFNEFTTKSIQQRFAEDYLENFGIANNYTVSDLPFLSALERNTQKYNFNYSDSFYYKLLVSKKIPLFPSQIIERLVNDREERYSITTYMSKIDNQYVIFKRLTNYKNEQRANAGSSDRLLMFVQGRLEGCINLPRADFADAGFHNNLFDDKGNLAREREVKIYSPHIHLPSSLYNVVFPARLNSFEAVELYDVKTFHNLVKFCDKVYNIDKNITPIFSDEDAAYGKSLTVAYDSYIKKHPEYKNNDVIYFKRLPEYVKTINICEEKEK